MGSISLSPDRSCYHCKLASDIFVFLRQDLGGQIAKVSKVGLVFLSPPLSCPNVFDLFAIPNCVKYILYSFIASFTADFSEHLLFPEV